MAENGALPDDLRCNRTDGRQWRCKRRVVEGKKLCEIHYIQGRHRNKKQKVPESLKIMRNTKNKKKPKIQNSKGSLEIGLRILKKKKKPLKPKPCVSEALDEALRRMELKRGDLPLELIRVFLKRQLEKKKDKESKNDSAELMREFPNAVMAIPPTPTENFSNAGSVLDIKLGLDSSSSPFSLRRFRSKNIEPLPISTMQAVPFAKNGKNLSRVNRRKCHWCRRSSYRVLIKCSRCKKQFFCLDCIKERYLEKQEIRGACPVCRGACSCRICKRNELKPSSHKEFCRHKRKVQKVQLLYHLVHLLLPVLEKINEEQRIEVEIEAKISGKQQPDIQVQQASAGEGKLYSCSNCKTSILDYHRICSECSYSLCLHCCWESRRGSLAEDCKSNGSNEEQACSSNFERTSRMKHTSTSRQSFSGIHYLQACADGSISCPPAEYGGCSNSILELRCVFPYAWIKELEISAEAILCSYNFQNAEHIFSSCSLCRGSDHKDAVFDSFIKVADRQDSRDRFLYCPSIKNLREENLEHFQKHWGEAHPIIVRNVLRNSPDLSWDPVVMFCTYLEKRSKCSRDKEAAKAQNHSDWCEVEIARKQIFMGSLEWQTHATMQRDMVKFRAWLSSHLFKEQFPAHYAEVLRALPLQEYMNPKSGLLNLAVKLPPEMPETDLGPSIYISYGGPEEVSQAEFVTKLCCESYDVVNILACATDVPISKEQIRKIKCLMKNKKPQDHKESTSYSSDQKGKSSLHSGDTEESCLQDGTGGHLPDGIAKRPFYSADSLNGQRYGDQDGNISSDNENDSEFESDVSLFCSGSVERSEDSDSDYLFEDVDSVKKEAKPSGAQWDVFRRQDVPKLLEYLRRHSSEFTSTPGYSKQVIHPILDRSFFFDAFHKLRLKEEFDIQPWTFEQHLGEAILIPAGCPYQVKQLKSCINVVLDFISPENVAECIHIIDEIRLLPEHHKAKGKVLEQVKKMAVCGISNAIAEIRDLVPTS
ncbi:lysine-specific demethylase JMJ28 isoform X1 [Nicotiana tabacum]|uniref:Lysine-specific demethylase JMJ28 isoform X1 n=1 Tax=Nicotiana tabacum TaxID=4097 RepID=A0AC58T101_TOBAC